MTTTPPLPFDAHHLLAHEPFVRRIAQSLLHDCDEAEDIVQETWLAALERPPTLDRPVRPWLARVAANLATQVLRRRGPRLSPELEPEACAAPDASGDAVDTDGLRRDIAAAVAALKEPYREVLVLRYFEGLGNRDVAARLGLPVETVRTRNRRGLAQLRGRIEPRRAADRSRWLAGLVVLAEMPRQSLWPAIARRAWSVRHGMSASALVVGGLYLAARADLVPAAASAQYLPNPSPAPQESLSDPPVSTEPAGRVAAQLPGQRQVLMHLVREGNGRPVVGARVEALVADATLTRATADSEGTLSLRLPQDEEADASLRLRIGATAYTLAHEEVLGLPAVPASGADPEAIVVCVPAACVDHGRVLDEEGNPIRGAEVRAYDADLPFRSDFERPALATTTTDEHGAFTLESLPLAHSIAVRARGHAGLEAQLRVLDRATEARGLEVRLEASRRLVGRVSDARGDPVAAAHVVVTGSDRNPRGSGLRAPAPATVAWVADVGQQAWSDEQGAFRIDDVPARTRTLTVFAPGFAHLVVDLDPGEERIDVVVRDGAELAVLVSDPWGRPLPGARVELAGRGSQPNVGMSDTNGEARLVGVNSGAWMLVRAEAPGYAPGFGQAFRVARNAPPLRVAVTRARSVAGTVVDLYGAPVAGARVRARAVGIGREHARPRNPRFRELIEEQSTLGQSTTAADGGFAFESLPCNHLELEIQAVDPARVEYFPLPAGLERVLCVLGHEPVSISGRVLDRSTGEPVPASASVQVQVVERGGEMRSVAVPVDGDATFHAGLPGPGPFDLHVRAEGFATWIGVLPEGGGSIEVALDRSHRLALLLRDARGAPVRGGTLLLSDETGEPVPVRAPSHRARSFSYVSGDGELELLDLPTRTLRLTFLPPALAPARTRLVDLSSASGDVFEWWIEDMDVASGQRILELDLRAETGTGSEAFRGACRLQGHDASGRRVVDCAVDVSPRSVDVDPERSTRTWSFAPDGALVAWRDAPLERRKRHASERGVSLTTEGWLALSLPSSCAHLSVSAPGRVPAKVQLDPQAAHEHRILVLQPLPESRAETGARR
ncbi:MAG TPA: sigma-70 family RNA polymerase sigma factor [Planctomycetota bacterium]|nr:sigma-70 family RNA polymerase sigma factor [Planctomycetota bacterium]